MKNDYGEEDQETNGREANHLGTYTYRFFEVYNLLLYSWSLLKILKSAR